MEELQLLEQVLSEFADDEAFAYYLLTALGPEQFLLLAGNVAVLQVDDGWHFDEDLGALVSSMVSSTPKISVRLPTGSCRTHASMSPAAKCSPRTSAAAAATVSPADPAPITQMSGLSTVDIRPPHPVAGCGADDRRFTRRAAGDGFL
jgi:hypothetical protein